jgi:hypothetical protein
MKLDLHTHSTLSDGRRTPEEIVDMACAAGLKVLSITDHDTLGAHDLARAALRGRPLHLIAGVEISASWNAEELHILAYFRDPVPDAIVRLVGDAGARREERMRRIVGELRNRGVAIDEDDVRAEADGSLLTRAHVARAMVARGQAASLEDAFDRHLHFRHGVVPLARVSVEEAIRTVAAAGGVPVWAHPPGEDLERRLRTMVKAGLRGIETFRRRTHGVRTARLVGLAESHRLLTTAGSDWHGHGGEPLGEFLSFAPARLRPFLREFGLDHLTDLLAA